MDVKEIVRAMKRSGYSMSDIYIYVKDYIAADEFVDLYEAA